MIRRADSPLPAWEARWDDHRLRWVKEHHVFGGVVVPAAAYLEMVIGASAELTGRACILERVSFERPCVLPDKEPMVTRVVFSPEASTFEIHSRAVSSDTWARNGKGRYFCPDESPPVRRIVDLKAVRTRCAKTYGPDDIYPLLARKGYRYGPGFRGITEYHVGDREGLARVEAPASMAGAVDGHRWHPALLDACFQSAILHPPVADGAGRSGGLLPYTYLLSGTGSVRVHDAVNFPVWCHTRVRYLNVDGFEADVDFLNDRGEIVAEVERLTGAPVQDAGRSDRLDNHLYTLEWKSQADERTSDASAPFAVDLATLREEVEPDIEKWSEELRRGEDHGEYVPLMARLCSAYMMRLLRELGVDTAPGSVFRTKDFSRVKPTYRPFLVRCLQFLAQDGVLRKRLASWTVEGGTEEADIDTLSGAIARRFGDWHPELTVLRRTGSALARVVTGAQDPLELLFPQEDSTLTEPLYSTSPTSRIYNRMVCRTVEALVQRSDVERPLRILEVGAGTGGLTGYLLPVLPPQRARYHFTDISAAFLKPLQPLEEDGRRPRFSEYDFVTTGVFDVERPPDTQGLTPGSYDLIVAANVIHATRILTDSLSHLKRLLTPGGILAMIEATPNDRWLQLTFGLTDGWWRFEDTSVRPEGPMLSSDGWLGVLGRAGFSEALALHDVPRGEASGQCVLLAQNRSTARSPHDDVGTTRAGRWLILADRGGLGVRLEEEIRRHGGHARCVRQSEDGPSNEKRIPPNDAVALKALMRSEDWEGVVHLWNLDQADSAPSVEGLERAVVSGSLSLSHVIAGLVEKRSNAVGADTKLYVATRGGQPITSSDISLTQAPAWGFL